MRPTFYIGFIIKCEWSDELVECETYLPFMVKMECDNYWGMDRNGKKWQLIGDWGSNCFEFALFYQHEGEEAEELKRPYPDSIGDDGEFVGRFEKNDILFFYEKKSGKIVI